MNAFVRYSPDVESEQPGEAADIEAIRASFSAIRRFTFDKHHHGLRDAHAKSHGILRAELRVHDDLPPELAQGIFASDRTYPAIIRLSTAPSDVLPDGVAALRGMALKVIGVNGEQVLPEHRGASTQDWVTATHPTIAGGNAAGFRRQATFIEQAVKAPEEVQLVTTTAARAVGGAARLAGKDVAGGAGGLAKPLTHILGDTFFTQAASRYGDYIAKLQITPQSDNVRALTGQRVPVTGKATLQNLVSTFFATQTASYEARVQLATDLAVMPVEDASVEWPEEQSPYRAVATVTVEPQDPYSAARRTYGDDVLSFNPWHAIEEHRPLGSIQRVRRPVYNDSSAERQQANTIERREPTSIEDLPS